MLRAHLPLPTWVTVAFGLDKIKCVSSTVVIQETCKDLDEKLKYKEAALKKEDDSIWYNHKAINEKILVKMSGR